MWLGTLTQEVDAIKKFGCTIFASNGLQSRFVKKKEWNARVDTGLRDLIRPTLIFVIETYKNIYDSYANLIKHKERLMKVLELQKEVLESALK